MLAQSLRHQSEGVCNVYTWLSVLLKDTSVTAGIRTHILLLTPELESGKLDRSATTPQNHW